MVGNTELIIPEITFENVFNFHYKIENFVFNYVVNKLILLAKFWSCKDKRFVLTYPF